MIALQQVNAIVSRFTVKIFNLGGNVSNGNFDLDEGDE